MAGMPYPPNLCASVGGFLCQNVLCVLRILWEYSPRLLVYERGSILPTEFTDFHRWLGCVIGGVGMAGCHTLLICAHLCLSVGGFLCQNVLCVPRILWDTLSVCFVGAALLVHLRQVHPLRVPPESAPSAIGFRPPPDQIPSAVQSVSVRRPIRFRPLHDAISSACTLRRLHCNTPHVPLLHPFMFAKLRNKFDF